MTINAFEAYKKFSAYKLHFNSKSYDYIKYNGKVKALSTVAASQKFLASKQKFFYAQLGRHEDPDGLILSNMLVEPKIFITELLTDEANERWEAWRKRQESLSYTLKNELENNDNWKSMLKVLPNGMPFLLDRYIGGEISPETIVIIDYYGHILDDWVKLTNPLIKSRLEPIIKYRPFVKFSKLRCKKILLELSSSK